MNLRGKEFRIQKNALLRFEKSKLASLLNNTSDNPAVLHFDREPFGFDVVAEYLNHDLLDMGGLAEKEMKAAEAHLEYFGLLNQRGAKGVDEQKVVENQDEGSNEADPYWGAEKGGVVNGARYMYRDQRKSQRSRIFSNKWSCWATESLEDGQRFRFRIISLVDATEFCYGIYIKTSCSEIYWIGLSLIGQRCFFIQHFGRTKKPQWFRPIGPSHHEIKEGTVLELTLFKSTRWRLRFAVDTQDDGLEFDVGPYDAVLVEGHVAGKAREVVLEALVNDNDS